MIRDSILEMKRASTTEIFEGGRIEKQILTSFFKDTSVTCSNHMKVNLIKCTPFFQDVLFDNHML
jgi:hypothetical protein